MLKCFLINCRLICVLLGTPVITNLSENKEVLTCEAEGVPEPQFKWSINVIIVSQGAQKGLGSTVQIQDKIKFYI